MDVRASRQQTNTVVSLSSTFHAKATLVKYQFNTAEWKSLPLEQRVARCRLMAHQARWLAQTANNPIRQCYLSIAEHWDSLASEMQQEAKYGAAQTA